MLLAGGLLEATALGRGMAMGKDALSREAQLLTGRLPGGRQPVALSAWKTSSQAGRGTCGPSQYPSQGSLCPAKLYLRKDFLLGGDLGGEVLSMAWEKTHAHCGPVLVASLDRLAGWDLCELSGWPVPFYGRSFRLVVWPGFRGNVILRNIHNGNSRNIKIPPAC